MVRIEDLQLPAGHVIISVGDRKMGAGEFMQMVGEEARRWQPYHPIDPSRVILYPEAFRVVPRALVDEWEALLDHQLREIDAFREKVHALPGIHVEISIG